MWPFQGSREKYIFLFFFTLDSLQIQHIKFNFSRGATFKVWNYVIAAYRS